MIRYELDQALEALNSISPDLSREDWIRVGMAAQAAGLSFEDFDNWSAQGRTYNPKACQEAWKSFRPDQGIGAGTLFHIAAQHGWIGKAKQAKTQRTRHHQSNTRHSALEIWDRCEVATADHPYVLQKQAHGVPLDQLRVVPAGDPLTILGESMAGALAIPVIRIDGSISSLQFVTTGDTAQRLKAKGYTAKPNLPSARLEGWFSVGDVARGSVIYVCEGLGTAWACWRATGNASVVCFGWGRVRSVASELRKRDLSARIVLCPDVGKETAAEVIAAEVRGFVAAMPQGWPENSDFCDLAIKEGADALAVLLESAKGPPLPFEVVPLRDMLHNVPSPPAFIWEGRVPIGVPTLLAAHGGTGKSTIMLMLAVATCMGLPLFGVNTMKRNVVFFSGEDGSGLLLYRLMIICRHFGIDPADLDGHLYLLDSTEADPRLYVETPGIRGGDISPTFTALRKFVQEHSIGLVLIDNASDVYDASEIDRGRVRSFMRSLTIIARENSAGVVLLAHVDKGTSRGERPGTESYSGSTAWHNSSRSRLFLSREKDGAALMLEHQKCNLGPLQPDIRLLWPEGGVPVLDEPLQPSTQAIADRVATKALLRLIAEFAKRGEHVSSSENSPSNAFKKFEREPSLSKRLKRAELFDLLRRAERSGYVCRTMVRTANRKEREVWEVTADGFIFADIAPSAPTAPTPEDRAPSAAEEAGAPSAPTHGARGMGGKGVHDYVVESSDTA